VRGAAHFRQFANMLGLASSTNAMLAGVAEAIEWTRISCAAPSSNKRNYPA